MKPVICYECKYGRNKIDQNTIKYDWVLCTNLQSPCCNIVISRFMTCDKGKRTLKAKWHQFCLKYLRVIS